MTTAGTLRGRAPSELDSGFARAMSLAEPEPWHKRDLVLLAAFSALGTAGIWASWLGISGEATFDDQQRWLVAGTGGAIVGAVGMVSWLLAGFKNVREAQRSLLAGIAGSLGTDLAVLTATSTIGVERGRARSAGILVSAPTMTRFHADYCDLVRDKEVAVTSLAEVDKRGLRPCGVCHP